MKSRGIAVIAAVVALGTGVIAGPAVATPARDSGGNKQCTRNVQRTDTTRFESRMCTQSSDTSVRTDIRMRVRAQLATPAVASDAKVRIRERVRSEERNGDMRVRVRTEHRRRVEGTTMRDEVRLRIDVRGANHPQVTIGTAANGVLPVTITQLDANGQPVVLRTLTLSVPQAS
jgi:flavin-dependent dehydrogenase